MSNDVTFHHRYTDTIGFSQRAANESRLLLEIAARRDIDFGRYNERGGGTTVAHLVWNNDGTAVLEGLTGTLQVSRSNAAGVKTTDEAFAALVLKYWLVFTEAEEQHKRGEDARRAQTAQAAS
jgi:hypothetical protein